MSVMVMAWTYEFRSNVVVSLNDSNSENFKKNFEELRLESEWGSYRDIDDLESMRQGKLGTTKIDRSDYGIDFRAFTRLPLVPYDWGKMKYAFDQSMYHVLAGADEGYYLQPEFYDVWFEMGIPFHSNPKKLCKAGFFAVPSGQRIYTEPGATIETFALIHSSFCTNNLQSFKLSTFYPEKGTTDDGIEYEQDKDVVRRYVSVDFDPGEIILGRTYPKFEKDWARKISVKINVRDGAPRGLYVVAVGATEYTPYLDARSDINTQAFKSRGGSPLMHLIIAVD